MHGKEGALYRIPSRFGILMGSSLIGQRLEDKMREKERGGVCMAEKEERLEGDRRACFMGT